MTRRYTQLAWAAAVCTYLLIILGAIVRITGSGLGCGEHWPLCNGRLLPPLDLSTLIEYSHRLAAALVSILVIALATSAWWMRRETRIENRESFLPPRPVPAAYIAFALLLLQIALGAITVRLSLPPWTVIVHLGTAMLLLASVLAAARPGPLAWPTSEASVGAILGFVTVLLGALTANLGAATACIGFPRCNGRLFPAGDALQGIHWAHRLLAYTLTTYVTVWALRTRRPGPLALLGLVALQVTVAAMMVLWALPGPLQAAHVVVGTALWAGLVLVAVSPASEPA